MRAPAPAVPLLRPARARAGGRRTPCAPRLDDPARVRADDDVRALRHRDGPFGRLAQRQAAGRRARWSPPGSRPSRSARAARRLDQPDEVEIAERLRLDEPRLRVEPPQQLGAFEPLRVCAGGPERRRDRRGSARRAASSTRSSCPGSSTLFGRCSVRTAYGVPSTPNRAGARRSPAAARKRSSVSIIVLPTKWIRSAGDPLAEQVLVGVAAGREEVGREVVGQAPVDLLGHPRVEAAQPCLDVRDGVALLDRDERARERRVDVADDDDDAGPDAQQLALELASSRAPSGTRGCPSRRRATRRARRARAPRRRCATDPRRSAGPCAASVAVRPAARAAGRIDAAFMKFGRAPTTTRRSLALSATRAVSAVRRSLMRGTSGREGTAGRCSGRRRH